MNKWFLHILFVCVTSMLVISCQDTEDDYMSSVNNREAQIMFTLSMDSPTARTRAAWGQEQEGATFLPGDDKESRIDMSQFIVKFEADGVEYLVTNILKWEDKDSKSCNFVGIVKDLDGNNLKQSITPETVKISVYVNMGSETIADDFEQSQSESTIPMWGVVTLDNKTFAPGERTNVGSVHLLRAMAKLEVTLTDEMKSLYALKGATLNKHNTQGLTLPKDAEDATSTLLMDQEDVFNPKASLTETAKELAVLATDTSYVIYLPEVASTTANPLNVAVNIVERETGKPAEGNFNLLDYSVNPDQPSDMNLVRNHWYKYEISGFAGNDIKVNLVKKIWVPVDITVGGEGFLFLNKDLIEIYNANIDSLQLKFASSSPIETIELKDTFVHRRSGIDELKVGEIADNSYAYYMNKFGVLTNLSDEEGFDEAKVKAAIKAEVSGVKKDSLNGGITIYSPFMADANAAEGWTEDTHYNTIRYLEFVVKNREGLKATFRVQQYPPVVITNTEGYFSYRDDQKLTDDMEEASHYHNYQGSKSIYATGLYWYHDHDWTAEQDQPKSWWDTRQSDRDYSWAFVGSPGLGCPGNYKDPKIKVETVGYGSGPIFDMNFIDSRGVEVTYSYSQIFKPTHEPFDYFQRARYKNLPGASSSGKYVKQGYKINGVLYDHPKGEVQGQAIGGYYTKDVEVNGEMQTRTFRKHYQWNIQLIFTNRFVDNVNEDGHADIYSMTIPSNPDSDDADFVVWGKQSYTNHRMYNIRTVNTSEDYVIGYPSLTSEGETENTPSNANMVSPNFCVASQLGETSYQSVLNTAVGVGYLMPSDGEFYKIAKEQCREYVETTYKDLNNNGHWDESEPVTHYHDWRLPTKAEIIKIMELQDNSRAMDRLLPGQYYFCVTGAGDDADKNKIENWTSPQVPGYDSVNKNGKYIRCVRDVKNIKEDTTTEHFY